MTGTMNNGRQLYLAQFHMANDGAATGDATSAWPGDLATVPTDLLDYLNVLVGKGYLKGGEYQADECSWRIVHRYSDT